MPFEKGSPVYVTPGTPVYGKIITESSPYVFVGSYIDKRMDPLPVWLISQPTEMIKLQQREYVRIDAKISAQVTLEEQDNDRQETLLITDISGGGLRLIAQKPYSLGTKLRIAFELPGQELIETGGLVVRSEHPQSDLNVYWLGVRYVGLPEKQRNKIVKFIFQKQLERHRRGF